MINLLYYEYWTDKQKKKIFMYINNAINFYEVDTKILNK